MDILQRISFQEEDPSVYLAEIDAAIKRAQTEHATKQTSHQQLLARFDWPDPPAEIVVDQLAMEAALKEKQAALAYQQKLLPRRVELQRKIATLPAKYTYSQVRLEELEGWLPLAAQREACLQEQKQLVEWADAPQPAFTQEAYDAAKLQEVRREQMLQRAKAVQLPYDEDELQNALADAQEELAFVDEFERYQALYCQYAAHQEQLDKEYQMALAAYKRHFAEQQQLYKQFLQQQRAHEQYTARLQALANREKPACVDMLLLSGRLQQLRDSRGILPCPACGIGLRWQEQRLVAGGEPIADLETKIAVVEQELAAAKKWQELEHGYNMLLQNPVAQSTPYAEPAYTPPAKPSAMPPPKPPTVMLQSSRTELQNYIKYVGSIEYITMPTISSEQLLAAKHAARYRELTAQLAGLPAVDMTELQCQRQYAVLYDQLSAMEPEDPELANEVASCQARLAAAERWRRYSTEKQAVDEAFAVVQETHGALQSAEGLYALATQLERECLQATVDSINAHLEELVARLFDEPMVLRLELFKEMKASKETKPYVNLAIYYRGCQYDGAHGLSGGEADLVSIALTLALAALNQSPFIIFDEVISSLDPDRLERCLEVLREYVPSYKVVICTAQSVVEGHFTRILQL